jgi:AraC-like DNA-binding protein
VRDLAAEVGWSTRHLEQEFGATIGLSPKTAARLRRFERSVPLVAMGQPLALVAARCGYADQAHMTREWRRLAGTTPGQWMDQDVLANVQDSGGAGHQDRRLPRLQHHRPGGEPLELRHLRGFRLTRPVYVRRHG